MRILPGSLSRQDFQAEHEEIEAGIVLTVARFDFLRNADGTDCIRMGLRNRLTRLSNRVGMLLGLARAQRIRNQIKRASLRLVEDTADVFTDDAECQKLNATKKQHNHK